MGLFAKGLLSVKDLLLLIFNFVDKDDGKSRIASDDVKDLLRRESLGMDTLSSWFGNGSIGE